MQTNGHWQRSVPVPVFDGDPGLVAFYEDAWRAVAGRFSRGNVPGEQHRMSDACFLAMVARYAWRSLPGVASLVPFYETLAPEPGARPPEDFGISPDSVLPLFAWVEYENSLFSGDTAHVRRLIRSGVLQRIYETFETREVRRNGSGPRTMEPGKHVHGYRWTMREAGMPGAPRGIGRTDSPDGIFCVDLLAQQCLAALSISRLAALYCDTAVSAKWRGKFSGKKTLLRRWYWDPATAYFHDVDASTMKTLPQISPAGFWAVLAGAPDLFDAARMAATISLPELFGGDIPFPSVPRASCAFDNEGGDDWRGAVQVPAAYVALRGISAYGCHAEARALGRAVLEHVRAAWNGAGKRTFHTAYSPVDPEPAKPGPGRAAGAAVPDVVCLGALAPICIFLEFVVGVHYVDAFRRLVAWDPPCGEGRVGVRNLKFGSNSVDMAVDGERCYIRAAEPFALVLNGTRREIPAGSSIIPVTPRQKL